MKVKISLLALFLSVLIFGQNQKKFLKEVRKFQQELNDSYKNPKDSPLRGENFEKFKQHPFFPINIKYRVEARLDKNVSSEVIEFLTSSGHVQRYQEYARAYFQLDGKEYSLMIYQNLKLKSNPEYADYLFLPFHDATNGKETYGGVSTSI